MDKRLNIPVSPELYRAIRLAVIDQEVTISEFTRRALVEKLEKDKKEKDARSN